MSIELLVGGPKRSHLQQKLLQANVGWYIKSPTNIDGLMPVTLKGHGKKRKGGELYLWPVTPKYNDRYTFVCFLFFLEQSLLYYLWCSESPAAACIWILKG